MDVTVKPDGTIVFGEFSPMEAYHIAVRLEEKGLAFYERAASAFHDPGIEGAFQHLAGEEMKHLALFEAQYRLESEILGEEADGEDLSALVDAPVFRETADLDDLFARLDSAQDAIRLGIRFETESIRFYEALFEATEKPGNRRAIAEVLEEERKHLEALQGLPG